MSNAIGWIFVAATVLTIPGCLAWSFYERGWRVSVLAALAGLAWEACLVLAVRDGRWAIGLLAVATVAVVAGGAYALGAHRSTK